jgi:hypothetical protein
MTLPIDMASVVPMDQMRGEDNEETSALVSLGKEADAYLKSLGWCRSVQSLYFGGGFWDKIGVFAAHIEPSKVGVDPWLWVVVGDVPSAYVVTDDATTPVEALETYCQLMEQWVDAVRRRTSFDGIFPVHAERTPANADLLANRIRMIRENVIPHLQSRDAPPYSGPASK